MDSLLDLAPEARPAPYKLNADQYFAMAEAGVLQRHERIELIEGEIVEMAPIARDHGGAVGGLTHALVLACHGRGNVFVQSSFRLDQWNVPEPDCVVLRWRSDFYVTGQAPSPADALLVVEVAQSSLAYDRRVKLPLYARADIPEYWIVNIKTKLIDVHRRPSGDAYTEETHSNAGDTLTLLADPLITVTLDVVFA